MTYPTQTDLTARLKWLVGAKAMAIVLALLMPTQVLAQSRTFYGADGRVSGRSITGSNGSTTSYDAKRSRHGPLDHKRQFDDDLRQRNGCHVGTTRQMGI